MRYLKARWSALILRYGVVYVAITLAAVFAKRWSVLLPFSVGFWIIFGTLILVEKLGSYTEFTEADIVQRYFFFRYDMPINNIISLKKGYARSITGTPKAVLMKFRRKDGSFGTYHIFPDQYAPQDIKAFAAELEKRSKKIEIDPAVKTNLSASVYQPDELSDLEVLKMIAKGFVIALSLIAILGELVFTIQVLGIPVQGITNL